MYNRGDIVKVYYDLPNSKNTNYHPAVILSNELVYYADDIYVCAMLTSQDKIDLFSFELTQSMLSMKNNKDFSQVRCHLVTYIKETHIVPHSKMNTVHLHIVDSIIDQINETVFKDLK